MGARIRSLHHYGTIDGNLIHHLIIFILHRFITKKLNLFWILFLFTYGFGISIISCNLERSKSMNLLINCFEWTDKQKKFIDHVLKNEFSNVKNHIQDIAQSIREECLQIAISCSKSIEIIDFLIDKFKIN